jgi:hypothetical protein
MAEHVRRRLTAMRAGVTMALFGLLAGLGIKTQTGASEPLALDNAAASAISTNAIGSAQIKNHSLQFKDLKLHQVPSYKEYKEFVSKISSRFLKLDTANLVHKADVYIKGESDAAFLHKADTAQNALKIDGLSSSQLIQGHGQVVTGNLALGSSDGDVFILIGLLKISAKNAVGGGPTATATLTNTSGQTLLVNGDGNSNNSTRTVVPGGTETFDVGDGSVRTLQIVVQGGAQAITISLSSFSGGVRTLVGQAVVGTL